MIRTRIDLEYWGVICLDIVDLRAILLMCDVLRGSDLVTPH